MPTPTLWSGWSRTEIFALVFTTLVTALVMWSVRRRLGSWLIPCLAFVPVPIVALFSQQYDLVGWHGFMHASPIYSVMQGGPVPPEEPLFAGGTLRYPWVEHWLVAQISRLSGLNVHLLTHGMELVAYAALLGAGWWLATAVTKDRGVVALTVLFTGYGISIFHVGLLADAFARAFPGLWLETRVIPVDKFANLSAMPLGYAAMALAFAAAVRLASGLGPPKPLAGVIAGATLLAALVHPLSWFCILWCQAVVGGVLLLSRRREDYRRLGWLALAVGVPCLLALPYLRSVGMSESSDGWTGITRPAGLIWAKAGDAGVFIAPLLLLAYVERAKLRSLLARGNRPLQIVLLAVPTLVLAYLLIRFPGRNEYKLLLCLVLSGAVILALCLHELIEKHRVLAGLFLFLLLTPAAMTLGYRPWFEVAQPCRMAGSYLRALDPVADELYQWIASETPTDAVFIAADLNIPPLGHRALYIAVDAPWRGRDGWGLTPYSLRQWHIRHPDTVMEERNRRAQQLLAASGTRPVAELVAQIQSDVPGRPLFVRVQDPAVRDKLDHTPGLSRRFQNAAGAVYAAVAPDAALRAAAR